MRMFEKLNDLCRRLFCRGDGITNRNAVAIVAGEIQPGSTGFDAIHEFLELSKTDVVLRN
ncbi:hypothetical protein Cflav_PD5716 [Pedosphaera parvula Ellin514]|uniref:Uncharacterized protein n=1 Tax=Pedosphaera parvula (strain Ellin514) TaxID=320771 RepID=B9XAP6_PEDPL|nr:hypothetical protein Cflav_PD5716 [Pedosphaera parvula Ellin514]